MRFDLPQGSAEAGSQVLFLRVPGVPGSASRAVPLRFVPWDGEVEILAPRHPPPLWAQALAQQGVVAWKIDDRWVRGVATGIEDPMALDATRRRFEAAFGDREVRRWFAGEVLGFRLREGVPVAREYHEAVARYFDGLAPGYDVSVESNPLDRRLRAVSSGILARAFARSSRVLEIGSGTGLETLPLARRGVRVVATDISSDMLERLSSKAAAEGLSTGIEVRRLAARDLRRILEEFGPAAFDGAFSDFGALNCEPAWGELPEVLHALVRPKGTLVLGLWNRYCAADAILSLAARTPRRVLARLENPVAVGRSRYGIPVFARSPGETVAAFREGFDLVRLTGVPVFVPPYDFAGPLRSRPGLLAVLDGLDAGLAERFPFNRMGDHFVAELRRRP